MYNIQKTEVITKNAIMGGRNSKCGGLNEIGVILLINIKLFIIH